MNTKPVILSLEQIIRHRIKEIYHGRGWVKAKCIDDGCDTITIWRVSTGVKCPDGKCANCNGPVKRTIWSKDSGYIVKH